MKRFIPVVAAAVALGTALTVPRAAVAQSAFPTPGARVRVSVRTPVGVTREGRLINATVDSLTIAFHGDSTTATIPITQIARLDVSTGRNLERGVSRGIETGLVAGVLLGAGLGLFAYAEELCPIACVVASSVLGSISGLAVGALVGAATAPDRWEEVPLRGGAGTSGMLRGHTTMRLGLTVSF